MATRATYLKIGVFVTLGICGLIAVAMLIGIRRVHRKVVPFYTYFEEDVTGLDVGSVVRVRGVPVGQVGTITIAPDHRHVEVRSDIEADTFGRLGFNTPEHPHVPPTVRAQLGTLGLTGVRYVAIDFFDERTNPLPVLSFKPAANYIPAARSIQYNLEQAATTAMTGLAEVVDTLRREQVSERVVHTTQQADEVIALVNRILLSIDRQHLPQRATDTVEDLQGSVRRINAVLDRVASDTGVLARAERSASAIGDVAPRAVDMSRNLEETLEELRATAAAIRHLADRLERDPDMLLKGRAKEAAR